MYKDFRAKYPQASLITKLVQIDHGQYIVQCQIENNQIVLSCGLAADRTVERAEDIAIERALRLLAIEDNSEVKTYFNNIALNVENKAIPKEYLEEALQKLNYEKIGDVLSKEKTSEIASNILNSDKQQREDDKLAENVFSSENIINETTKLAEEQSTTELYKTSSASENFDFSSVIAKTNVELKRLGWTNQQGKDHLMENYGKRSRQLLTDDELLDFLKFLEAQSTPPGLF